MQQNKKYRMVGLFVIVGLASLLGIVLSNIGQKFTSDDDFVVMYFEESIQGLSVGSSVMLQGVEIGQVKKIKLVANLAEGSFLAPVYVAFDKRKLSAKNKDLKVSNQQLFQNLIDKGLRAELTSSNLLTGQLMIALVMDPEQPIVLKGDGKYHEIPTTLSAFAKFSKDLNKIPLHESLTQLGNVLVDLDEHLPTILSNTAQITQKLDTMLDKRSGEFSKTMQNINTTMEEISKASRSIKNLTDYLERHPEAILRGKEK
ncbi:MAG: MCE family protein [Alphaproteobacteria bacterium]|nr:MCE family protein [Alphaproteobacteria bacterium]